MKKALLFTLALILLTTSGCTTQKQLRDQSVVQAVGVDHGEGEYDLSVQLINPKRSSGKDMSVKEDTFTLHASGESVIDALRNIALSSGKEPFYTHNRLIVIGEETAKLGIRDLLDVFERDSENRPDAYIALSGGSARDVVEYKSGMTDIPAEQLTRIIDSGSFNTKVSKVTVADVMRRLAGGIGDVYLPVFDITKDGDKEEAEVKRIAVFTGDKLAGYLEDDDIKGFFRAAGKMERCIEILDVPGFGRMSVETSGGRVKYDVKIEKNRPVFIINITCKGSVVEMGQSGTVPAVSEIEKALNEKLRASVESAVRKAFIELNSDVFSFKRRLEQCQRKYYNSVKNDIDGIMEDAEIIVNVKSTVSKMGQVN